MANYGTLVQAIGPVIDVRFKEDTIPPLLVALKVKLDTGKELTMEVVEHVGDDTVRCIAMGATEGVRRNLPVLDTGKPIEVPVGDPVLGRMFNVLGQPIDNAGPFESRSSTFSAPTSAAARSASLAAPVSARPS